MENQTIETFNYTYSAKQQEEIKQIRSKYMPKEEDKMERLRKLDRSVTMKGTMYSIMVGVIGTLILGAGMSLALVWGDTLFVLGIIVGIIGLVVLGVAYPLFQKITKQEREKIAPEIIKLTEELMK
ncbi:MAG: DUF2207 domain-containing protein [Lachnospiraceae bacterium]|nr:DUF2207 domain-containing protein [Lachnospiraceae bacterium]